MTTNRAPDPIDIEALRHWITHGKGYEQHSQVPEIEADGTRFASDREIHCAAHSEGQNCCLDYFHDAVLQLLSEHDTSGRRHQ